MLACIHTFCFYMVRYPSGESYLDVIQRLEPVIIEIERERECVCVVAHQAILRALYGYFTKCPLKVPYRNATFGCLTGLHSDAAFPCPAMHVERHIMIADGLLNAVATSARSGSVVQAGASALH